MNGKNNSKINCNIVLDLLPNYIDNVTSEVTRRDIEEHLKECESCKAEYISLTKSMKADALDCLKESEMLKDGLVKTRRIYMLRGIFVTILFLSLLIPGIVNFAINKRFTWFYIVAASVALVFAVVMTAVLKKENKLIWTLGAATVLVPLYLFFIENIINKFFMVNPASWFMSKALPVCCIWAAIIWITVLLAKFTNVADGYCVGVGFVLAIFGAMLTNGVFLKENGISAVLKSSWISILVCCLCALISVMIGYGQSAKK